MSIEILKEIPLMRTGKQPTGTTRKIGLQGTNVLAKDETKKLPAAQPASVMSTGRASGKSLERRPSKRKFTAR